MRWLVEVTSLGKGETESITVEADSWHRALEATRKRRGEMAALNDFAFELLDDGCKAIDPRARLRYTVRSAPPPTETPAGPTVPEPTPLDALPHEIAFTREEDATDAVPLTYREYVLTVRPGTTETAAGELLRRHLQWVQSSLAKVPSGKVVQLAVFDGPYEVGRSGLPLAALAWKDWNQEPWVTFPRSIAKASASREELRPAATISARVSASSPVAASTRAAPTSSAAAPAPASPVPASAPSPSIAPLTRPTPAARPAATAARTPTSPVPAATPSPAAASPTRPAPSATPAATAAPRPTPTVPAAAPTPPAVDAPAQAATAAPAATFSATGAAATPAEHALGDQGSPPAIVSVSSDGVAATPADERIRTRLSGDELLAELFESMHELQFASDAVAGSDFCLSVAMATIPSEAAVAYLYDMGRREFVVASTSGTRVDKFRDRRYADHDPLLSHAMRESGALIVDNTGDGKTALPERYAELGKVRSLVIAGAKLNRRFLGAIELIDPLDGLPFTSTEGNALSYIAEQFGEFVASRGIAPESAHSLPSRKRK